QIKEMPGMVDAFVLEGNSDKNGLMPGVAIVGKSTWQVFKAKQSLKVQWDDSGASHDSWTGLSKQAKEVAGKEGDTKVATRGDVDVQFANVQNKTISAFYTYPF